MRRTPYVSLAQLYSPNATNMRHQGRAGKESSESQGARATNPGTIDSFYQLVYNCLCNCLQESLGSGSCAVLVARILQIRLWEQPREKRARGRLESGRRGGISKGDTRILSEAYEVAGMAVFTIQELLGLMKLDSFPSLENIALRGRCCCVRRRWRYL